MDPFTLRFHSLNGSTIDEKRRHFNSFLKSLESDTGHTKDVTDFISSIKPTNQTEELFRIELLMQFKHHDLLRNELKNNSPFLVRKLLKNWKLFADIFSNINAQTLVNDILPYVSYSLKLKLLNGICKNVKNEILVDEYFLILEKKYGSKIALILLTGSTMDLIKSKIAKLYIILTNKQLISILKKDKQFLEYYFDILQKRDTNFDLSLNYSQSFKFIAEIDSNLYWKLSEKYKFHMIFGKHMTAKMFRTNRAKVLNDIQKYRYDFKMCQLYKTIRKDGNLKSFLLNTYPATIEGLASYNNTDILNSFISLLPKHDLYSVIISTCKEKYGKNLLDYPEYWEKDFIKFIPVKERENILNILVKKDEALVYLYQTCKSFPAIQDRLQHTSGATARSKLTNLMYKTCAVNENKEALLEALHFVLNRYKNDINVMTSFFYNVIWNWPNVVRLEEKYWKYIADMAKIIEIQETYYHEHFYIKYICHLLEYDIPCQEQCKQFIKHMYKNGAYGRLYCLTVEKKYERQFIEHMGECITTLKEQEHYQNVCVSFLGYLVKYNNRYTTAQIPYNNYSNFFDFIKSNYFHGSEVAIEFGLKTYQTEFWHELFWNYHENRNLNYGILSWYLKNYPEKLVQNINKVINSLSENEMEMLVKQSRRSLDEDASKQIAMHALDNLYSKDKNKKKLYIKIISILKPELLSECILPLLAEPKVNINFRKLESNILQKELIKNLHKLGNPLCIFPLIPKFCTRYYFRSALSSLQSVAYHTPMLHVKHNLMNFFNKVPFIRKQILIFAKNLLEHDTYVKLLEEFCERETNISIKNIIFMKTLQHFIDNPSDSLWILTQNFFKLLDTEDREVFNCLLKLEEIPPEYLSRYITFTYEELSKKVDFKIKEKRFQLLDSIPSQVIGDLNSEFMKRVIGDTACLENISNFHWKCVFGAHGKRQEELFEKNFETLQIFVEENRINLNKDATARSVITNFVYRFLDIAIELKQGGNLIEKFIASWTSTLQPNSFCKEYTTLLFTDLYFKSNFEVTQTGITINQLLCNYVEKFGRSIIPVFSRHLLQFLDKIDIRKQEQIIKFIEGFVRSKDNENVYLVLIHILAKISRKNSDRNNCNIKEIQERLDLRILDANPVIKFHYEMCIARK